jgi:hypothetical protein
MDSIQLGALAFMGLLVIAIIAVLYFDERFRRNLKVGDKVFFQNDEYRVKGTVLLIDDDDILITAEDGKVYEISRKSIQIF